jgi:uncharacterized protein (TIRG00374 family)
MLPSSSRAAELPITWRASLREALPRIVVGAGLGTLALWLAFRGTHWAILGAALHDVHYTLVVLAVLAVLATLLMSTARWRLLFYPDHHGLPWRGLFNGVVLAQMLNIIIPARLGDIARIYALPVSERISKVRILATVVIEKTMDLAVVGLSVFLLLLTVSLPPWLRNSGKALLVTILIAACMVVILGFRGSSLLAWVERQLQRLPGAWGVRLTGHTRSILDGFSSVRYPWISFYVWSLSFLMMVVAAATNYILFIALDLRLPPIAALFLLVVLQIGIAPPSLPGKIGVFHYLVVLGLSVYSVDKSVALSYAIVLYVVAFLPKIVIGAIILGLKKHI